MPLHVTFFPAQVGAGDWTNMIIPSVEISQASLVTYRLQFSLHNLEERTSYEVIIQTRNRAGWSPSSDIFVFTTSASRLATRGQWFAQSASRGDSVVRVPSISYFIVFSIIIIRRAGGNNIFCWWYLQYRTSFCNILVINNSHCHIIEIKTRYPVVSHTFILLGGFWDHIVEKISRFNPPYSILWII